MTLTFPPKINLNPRQKEKLTNTLGFLRIYGEISHAILIPCFVLKNQKEGLPYFARTEDKCLVYDTKKRPLTFAQTDSEGSFSEISGQELARKIDYEIDEIDSIIMFRSNPFFYQQNTPYYVCYISAPIINTYCFGACLIDSPMPHVTINRQSNERGVIEDAKILIDRQYIKTKLSVTKTNKQGFSSN